MDYAATTPTDSRVLEAMEYFWKQKFGNPSSIHNYGQEAREGIEIARKNVSQLLGAESSEIIFTSGGTEADNTAIKGIGYALRDKGNHIITTAIEHHAVIHACEFMISQGFKVTFLNVGPNGILDPEDVKKAITRDTILISVMHANNEIGTIQPVTEIGAIARERSILFHVDAVQTYGHVEIDVNKMGIDLLSLSAHKLNGPKGVGALYLKKGTPMIPLIHGGGQEQGLRSSTYNVTGIVGLGKASEIAKREMKKERIEILNLRNTLLNKIRDHINGIHLNGDQYQRLPNNLNVSIENVEGEALLMNLDLAGIAVSSGSACSSESTEPSYVLKAIRISNELARGSIRLTLGRFSTKDEVEKVADVLINAVKYLRSLSPFSEVA
jgi:cysteine desulfurase